MNRFSQKMLDAFNKDVRRKVADCCCVALIMMVIATVLNIVDVFQTKFDEFLAVLEKYPDSSTELIMS